MAGGGGEGGRTGDRMAKGLKDPCSHMLGVGGAVQNVQEPNLHHFDQQI